MYGRRDIPASANGWTVYIPLHHGSPRLLSRDLLSRDLTGWETAIGGVRSRKESRDTGKELRDLLSHDSDTSQAAWGDVVVLDRHVTYRHERGTVLLGTKSAYVLRLTDYAQPSTPGVPPPLTPRFQPLTLGASIGFGMDQPSGWQLGRYCLPAAAHAACRPPLLYHDDVTGINKPSWRVPSTLTFEIDAAASFTATREELAHIPNARRRALEKLHRVVKLLHDNTPRDPRCDNTKSHYLPPLLLPLLPPPTVPRGMLSWLRPAAAGPPPAERAWNVLTTAPDVWHLRGSTRGPRLAVSCREVAVSLPAVLSECASWRMCLRRRSRNELVSKIVYANRRVGGFPDCAWAIPFLLHQHSSRGTDGPASAPVALDVGANIGACKQLLFCLFTNLPAPSSSLPPFCAYILALG